MIDFKIDKDKCTQCGLCSQDCPVLIIDGKGVPFIKDGKEGLCIKCQHCLAICPTGALSIWGKNPDDSMLVRGELPTPQAMERLVKTRRSIRTFKDEAVDPKLIQYLVETAAYAPTGHNKNSVLLSLIDTKEELSKFRTLVYDGIKKVQSERGLPASLKVFSDWQRLWESKQIDVLFRNAPHLLIASAPSSISSPEADSHITLSYFELLANTNGIGTLWNGLLKMVMQAITPDLVSVLGIPNDHVIGYFMVFGLPKVKYARAVQSEGLHLNRIHL